MRFEWFIARRYLRGTHRGRTLISTAGVTIGVAVLVVVISVMNGFEREFLGKLLGAVGHLSLYPSDHSIEGLADYEAWLERFRNLPGIRGISPVVEQGVMVIANSRRRSDPKAQFVQVRGIDPRFEGGASDLLDAGLIGDWSELSSAGETKASTATELIDPFEIEAKTPGIFLGLELAKELFRIPPDWHWSETDVRLKAYVEGEVIGQKVKLVTPEMNRGPSMEGFVTVEAEVRGLFKTGFFDFDARFALVSLGTARILKRLPPDTVQYLEAKLEDPAPKNTYAMAVGLIEEASKTYGKRFNALPWMAYDPVILDAVRIEKVVMSAILNLVVLVAAFGIASTLVMTVLEKTREIGTLMALGARRRSIMRIFVFNGLQVGIFGTLFGDLFGLGICKLIAILHIAMPGGGNVYVLDTVPVEIRWRHIAIISLFALVASTLAGVYPAWKAARLHPVEALRYE